jgi:hypothetical protein
LYGKGFGCLTSSTSFHIFCDIFSDRWLPVIFSNEKHGFRDSGVFCSGKIVVKGNYPPFKVVMFYHNKTGTKGPMTISERDSVLGGKSLNSIRMSPLLPKDIPVKI